MVHVVQLIPPCAILTCIAVGEMFALRLAVKYFFVCSMCFCVFCGILDAPFGVDGRNGIYPAVLAYKMCMCRYQGRSYVHCLPPCYTPTKCVYVLLSRLQIHRCITYYSFSRRIHSIAISQQRWIIFLIYVKGKLGGGKLLSYSNQFLWATLLRELFHCLKYLTAEEIYIVMH